MLSPATHGPASRWGRAAFQQSADDDACPLLRAPGRRKPSCPWRQVRGQALGAPCKPLGARASVPGPRRSPRAGEAGGCCCLSQHAASLSSRQSTCAWAAPGPGPPWTPAPRCAHGPGKLVVHLPQRRLVLCGWGAGSCAVRGAPMRGAASRPAAGLGMPLGVQGACRAGRPSSPVLLQPRHCRGRAQRCRPRGSSSPGSAWGHRVGNVEARERGEAAPAVFPAPRWGSVSRSPLTCCWLGLHVWPPEAEGPPRHGQAQ